MLPRIFPVELTAGGGDATPAHARASLLAAAETEIDGLRPWREGSPASRIHWQSFARGAGLMERKLISEADSRPLVVIDPRAPSSPEALDAAVRAAGSLAVHFARKTGCSLLMPGDRRASVIEHDLLAWPALHVRLALMDDHAGPSLAAAQNRRGLVIYVAARPVDRAPRGLGRTPGGCLVVVPGADGRPPRDPRGRRLPRLRRRPPLGRRRRGRGAGGRGVSATLRLRPRRRATTARSRPSLSAPARPAIRAAAGATIAAGRRRARDRVRRARGLGRAALDVDARAGRAGPRLDWSSSSGCSRSPRCSAPGGSTARRRTLAAVAAIVPLTALMLLAGRVADELVLPGGWSELAGGISRGISDLPGVRVPYRGLDDWVRTVIPLGGSALVAARRAARVLAAPRRKLGLPGARAAGAGRALRRAGGRAGLHARVPARRGCSRC